MDGDSFIPTWNNTLEVYEALSPLDKSYKLKVKMYLIQNEKHEI